MDKLEQYEIDNAKLTIKKGIDEASHFLKMDGVIELKFIDDEKRFEEGTLSILKEDRYLIIYNTHELIKKNRYEQFLASYVDSMHIYHFLEITIPSTRYLLRYEDKIEKIELWEKEYEEMKRGTDPFKIYDSIAESIAFGSFFLKLMKDIDAKIPDAYKDAVTEKIKRYKENSFTK